ncbi:uncharacterized protein [Antedon mediterranea]|uniref:uncharacterized protein n=1 Tax=Antedon mediterranea TaxID=105859 RepID=UPI003AF9BD53
MTFLKRVELLLLVTVLFSCQYVESSEDLMSEITIDYISWCYPCNENNTLFSFYEVKCYCDDKCIIYGDCCKEKYDTFNKTQIKETIMSTATCQNISYIDYYIIGSCDSSWNNEYIRNLCETATGDILNILPVFDSNGDHYRNIYCAVCNSVPKEDMTMWSVREHDMRRFQFVVPDDISSDLRPRHCRPRKIGFCGHTSNEKCPGYFATVSHKTYSSTFVNVQYYNNPECAACNGLRFDVRKCTSTDVYMPPHRAPPFGGLHKLFSYGVPVSALPKKCRGGEIFDKYRDICVLIFCPEGYKLFQNQCVSVLCEMWKVQLKVIAKISQNYTSHDTFSCILSNLPTISGSRESYSMSSEVYSRPLNNQLQQLLFELLSYRDYSLLRSDLSEMFPPNKSGICDVASVQVDQFCANVAKPENCSSVGINIDTNVFPVNVEKQTMLFINQSDSYHSMDASLFSHHYTQHQNGFNSTTLLIPCFLGLQCPYIIDNLTDYLSVNNTLQHKHTHVVYSFESYKVVNDTVKICLTSVENEISYDVQTIISVVGCILSLFALALTFIVYSLLPSLRTLPGKSIMSLTVALFAAQFILTFGAGQTNNSIFCTLIAVTMHFFWLASFFWMSVLAYDVSKTFNNTHNRNASDDRKSFTKYSVKAWGIPFAIVVICFILSLNVKSLDFEYGSTSSCWISNYVVSLIIFGGPVLSAVCLNMFFFARMVHGVRGTMKTSATLRKRVSTAQSYSELKIYLKITSLMGFSWIFGFIATFTGAEILWYFFIVLCSLQGVFIFMSFVCNARVYGLLREKYQIHRQPPTSSGSLAMNQRATNSP